MKCFFLRYVLYLELIDDINKQRELNRETKNRVQAETGRLRRQVQGLSDMKDQRANAQGNPTDVLSCHLSSGDCYRIDNSIESSQQSRLPTMGMLMI